MSTLNELCDCDSVCWQVLKLKASYTSSLSLIH